MMMMMVMINDIVVFKKQEGVDKQVHGVMLCHEKNRISSSIKKVKLDDEVLKVINDQQDVDSDDSDDSQPEEGNLVDDDDDDNDIVVFQETRRGRQAGSWRNAVLRKEQNFFFQ